MWRDETGFLEMFLAYYSQCLGNLTPNMAYRDFLFHVLSVHEESLAEPNNWSCRKDVEAVVTEPQHEAKSGNPAGNFFIGAFPQTSDVAWEPITLASPSLNAIKDMETKQRNDQTTASSGSGSKSSLKGEVIVIEDEEDVQTWEDSNVELRLENDEIYESRVIRPSITSVFNTTMMVPGASQDCDDDEDNASKPYVCQVCNRGFSRRFHLRRHETTHAKSKFFPCKICKKSFMSEAHLRQHLPMHTRRGTHACKVCNKEFGKVSHLRRHERIHSGEKPFVCNVCGKGFISRSHLRQHEPRHSGARPFVCKVCSKTFKYIANLREHERIHTGVEPYQCSTCGKTFRHMSSWKSHERIHSGERPYVCKLCSKSFTHLSCLRVHHERIHSLEYKTDVQ